jgi:glutamine cyclotransferase
MERIGSNRRFCIYLSLTLFLISCSENSTEPEIPANFTYKIINQFNHDAEAFTQGLVFDNGVLYEGTGLNGKSSLRRVNITSGEVLQIHHLSSQYFGEGITTYQDKIIQLTFLSQVAFLYDKNSFQLIKEFNYTTQGWGITHDGKNLIMSDGSSTLYFRDPETFEEIGQIQVKDNSGPVSLLNELEFIGGKIYANVWKADRIAVISPESGEVVSWIDLTGLLSEDERTPSTDVLNGIAYDQETQRLLVTGKLWPKLFEIELYFYYLFLAHQPLLPRKVRTFR